jgi:hypothetical protein
MSGKRNNPTGGHYARLLHALVTMMLTCHRWMQHEYEGVAYLLAKAFRAYLCVDDVLHHFMPVHRFGFLQALWIEMTTHLIFSACHAFTGMHTSYKSSSPKQGKLRYVGCSSSLIS